jgi:CRP/FNR family transcriptional regulator, cyclic AMP receptor protein
VATMSPAAARLQSVPLFHGLPPAVIEDLAARARRRRFAAGEVIFHEGDPGRSLCVLDSGRIKITAASEQGQEALLAVVGPGEFFGELALFDDSPRSADAVAIESTQTLNLTREDFLKVLDQYPAVARHLLAVLARTIRRLTAELSDIVFLDVDSRIAKRLLDLAESHGQDTAEGRLIALALSQAEIGQMVGATRESVNQCLRRFQSAGLIKVARQKIVVLKPDALQRRITY